MKYILKTTYPCLIKTKNDECELNENDLLEIENEDRLFVYPENPEQIPFYVNLKSPKETAFLSILNHHGQTLLFLEDVQNLQVSQKETLNMSGKKCEVSVHGQQISFESENRRVEYLCSHPCELQKIFKLKDYACIQFDADLYAYSIKKNKLSHFSGEISVDGEMLTLTKNFNDSENRKRQAKYKFEDDIIMQEENFIHSSNSERNELVPYKLMESVKAKDFEHALTFLTENLKNQIDSTQIRDFFGNFSMFLPLSTTEFITISGKQKKYVKFNMQGGLIDDITVDTL